jgi:hypothetical protein
MMRTFPYNKAGLSLVVLIVMAVGLTGVAATMGLALKRKADPQWCGAPGARDLICQIVGQVVTTPIGSPPHSVSRRASVVSPGSEVRVAQYGEAHITFEKQAKCAFGVGSEPTEIVTRYGANHPLFWQRHGLSLCTFAGAPGNEVEFFCEQGSEGECPVAVSTTGTTEVVTRTSNPVVMEFCSGAFQARVANAYGHSEASASAPVSGRVRLTITDTEENTATSHSGSIGLAVSFMIGPGICASSTFRQQRHDM